MKKINKVLIVIALAFVAIAGILSAISWLLNDEGYTSSKLFNEMLGKFGSEIDKTIKFAYIGNLMLSILTYIPIFVVLIVGWQYKKQLKPIKLSIIIASVLFSVAVLSLSIVVLIETNNLMSETWFNAHAVIV